MENGTRYRYDEATFDFFELVPLLSVIVFSLISAIGVLGNGIVIVVYAFNKTMRDSTNTLIINLACSDLIFVVVCVPFTAILYCTRDWPFPAYWCSLVSYLQVASAYSSVWTLTLLAWDRFMAVVIPFRSISWRTVTNTTAACLIVWTVILMVNAPLLKMHDKQYYNHDGANRSTCVHVGLYKKTATDVEIWTFYGGFAFSAYLLPLTLLAILYVLIVRKLWESRVSQARPVEMTRYKRRVTMMLFLVSLTFAVCWLPQNLRFLTIAVNYPDDAEVSIASFVFQLTAQVLAYGNSCMNPILYGILSTNFRKGFHNFVSILSGRPPQYTLRRGTCIRLTPSPAPVSRRTSRRHGAETCELLMAQRCPLPGTNADVRLSVRSAGPLRHYQSVTRKAKACAKLSSRSAGPLLNYQMATEQREQDVQKLSCMSAGPVLFYQSPRQDTSGHLLVPGQIEHPSASYKPRRGRSSSTYDEFHEYSEEDV